MKWGHRARFEQWPRSNYWGELEIFDLSSLIHLFPCNKIYQSNCMSVHNSAQLCNLLIRLLLLRVCFQCNDCKARNVNTSSTRIIMLQRKNSRIKFNNEKRLSHTLVMQSYNCIYYFRKTLLCENIMISFYICLIY